jgi:prophage tail gpP-like protein
MTAFNPAEIAKLVVGDVSFQDWESVWVQHRWQDSCPQFRFTAAENATMPISWIMLQFKPGDRCTITLGGQLAITGIILVRQTSYDANNHAVELSGVGLTWLGSASSVDTKDANFDQMPIKAVADKLYGKHGVSVLQIGNVSAKPFEQCQAHPGELIFDCIDRLARQRGATLGSDHLGNMLLIGDHSYIATQTLAEGDNIKKMQCIISIEATSGNYSVIGQSGNAEQMSPTAAASIRAEAPGTLANKFKQLVSEQAHTQEEAMMRAYHESKWSEGTKVRAFVTVQGWLADGVHLWRCGDDVYVVSPSAMLNGIILKIQTITFQQDNQGGTVTVLELVLPWMLGDSPYSVAPVIPNSQPDPDAVQPPPPPPAVNAQ